MSNILRKFKTYDALVKKVTELQEELKAFKNETSTELEAIKSNIQSLDKATTEGDNVENSTAE